MKKKTKPKAKKKTVTRKTKKVARKKKTRKTPKKPVASLLAEAATLGLVATDDDPLGCCYWIDTSGNNRWMLTTQSACKGIPNATFRANKQCPGGG
jgi:uncharacterized cupin superfamily protein